MTTDTAQRVSLRTDWFRTGTRRISSSIANVYRPLLVVIAAGAVLRLLTMLLYSSAVFNYYGGDSTRYMRLKETGYIGLWSDPNQPIGYPLFLEVMRWFSSSLPFAIGVQHLLGLVTAVFLYAAVRRLDTPRWVALVPAAVVALSGDVLFLEHALLTETLWTVFLAAGLYAVVRGVDEHNRWRWLVLAGTILAFAGIVRHASQFLPLIAAAWVAFAIPARPKLRLAHAGAVVLPVVLVLSGYFALAKLNDGHTGIAEMGGFALYGRVGQFADCSKFTPPSGTRVLCEDTPPADRGGPFFYTFNPASPMYKKYGATPHDAKILGRFARQAVLHQPLDYAKAVLVDVIRYAAPGASDRPYSGATPANASFGSVTPSQQAQSLPELARQYDEVYSDVGDATVSSTRRNILETYQSIFRLNGLELVALLGFALVGIWRGRGLARKGAVLFTACAVYLYLVPPLLSSYDARYGIPPAGFLVAGAALGAWALAVRRGKAEPVQ